MSPPRAKHGITTDDKQNQARGFVWQLKLLAGYRQDASGIDAQKKNLGALAALRRGLGRPAGAAAEMYPYVVPHLPDASRQSEAERRRTEDAYFLIAALFAWHQMDWAPSEAEKGWSWNRNHDFGASFRWLADVTKSESIERRFVALLNAHRDDLPEHLRHAVGLLKSKTIPVSWAQLLLDVIAWDDPGRATQRAWARHYWQPPSPDATTPETPETSETPDEAGAQPA